MYPNNNKLDYNSQIQFCGITYTPEQFQKKFYPTDSIEDTISALNLLLDKGKAKLIMNKTKEEAPFEKVNKFIDSLFNRVIGLKSYDNYSQKFEYKKYMNYGIEDKKLYPNNHNIDIDSKIEIRGKIYTPIEYQKSFCKHDNMETTISTINILIDRGQVKLLNESKEEVPLEKVDTLRGEIKSNFHYKGEFFMQTKIIQIVIGSSRRAEEARKLKPGTELILKKSEDKIYIENENKFYYGRFYEDELEQNDIKYVSCIFERSPSYGIFEFRLEVHEVYIFNGKELKDSDLIKMFNLQDKDSAIIQNIINEMLQNGSLKKKETFKDGNNYITKEQLIKKYNLTGQPDVIINSFIKGLTREQPKSQDNNQSRSEIKNEKLYKNNSTVSKNQESKVSSKQSPHTYEEDGDCYESSSKYCYDEDGSYDPEEGRYDSRGYDKSGRDEYGLDEFGYDDDMNRGND